MSRRVRKFIGAVGMLAFVLLYSAIVMLVAQTDHIRHADGILQAIFFLVVGLLWIVPLMPLIKWMERPDVDPPTLG